MSVSHEQKGDSLFWQLNRITLAFAAEKDLEKLFEIVVRECMLITNSDAGSLYVREVEEGRDVLCFRAAVNASRDFPFKGFSIPLDTKSIAGYAAVSQRSLKIDDTENLPAELTFRYNGSFDFSIRYKSVNMLAVPLVDREGRVVGVVQLINKKRVGVEKLGEPNEIPNQVTEFSDAEILVLEAVGSQAAMVIERAKLQLELKELPFSFIEALVTALDARDLLSSGHARRVAARSRDLALALSQERQKAMGEAIFSSDALTAIFYAGLLHDIGKIGVSEAVLLKTERLSVERMRSIHFKFLAVKNVLLEKKGRRDLSDPENVLLSNIEAYYEVLVALNKKMELSPEELNWVKYFHAVEFPDFGGKVGRLVDGFEKDALMIAKGHMSPMDASVMELHVNFSYDLLKNIHWPGYLASIPEMVKLHHERIDGSGYPLGLQGAAIPLEARILAVVDEYDNLAERTRHGAEAMGYDKAAQELRNLAEQGKHDRNLCEKFLQIVRG